MAVGLEEDAEPCEVLEGLTTPELNALALATTLFLAKYDKTSPTYNTTWASLYAGAMNAPISMA